MEEIEAEIRRLSQDNPLLKRRFEILISISGVGDLTAFVLLAEMPEHGRLDGKQAAALAGLAPMVRQSGRWTGRACLRGGRSRVRRGLYMAALSACRFNQDLKAKYQAFKKAGKPLKVALSALRLKLIVLANCLLPRSGLGKEGSKDGLEPRKHIVPWWVQTLFPMLKSTKRSRF